MKRNIIKVSDYSVTLTGNNIWMTYWEIAEAFNVIPASVNRTIKRMFKENVFSECEHSKYIRLSNGNHAYVQKMADRQSKGAASSSIHQFSDKRSVWLLIVY